MVRIAHQPAYDINLVLCGEAGEGIQTAERFLTALLKFSGFHVFATREFMSRIRGGSNSTDIRIASRRIAAPVRRIDILIPFDMKALEHVRPRLSEKTFILGDKMATPAVIRDYPGEWIHVPFSEIAREAGGDIYTNIIAAALIGGILTIDKHMLDQTVRKIFFHNNATIIQNNIHAAQRGYKIGQELTAAQKISFHIQTDPGIKNDILMNGAEAIGIGAIGGGCNFIASYPMSPSTAVLTFLAQKSETFPLIVEQAEDEISAINMALGAWFAGGRAMVTTSGGGFALMEETIGLAGMIESPAVIHLAQRPGPATGLPTRTEQGDLQLALYSGHGEFPRIILAPCTCADAIYMMHHAFNCADKYQIPVFILTDQFFMDSTYNIPLPSLDDMKITHHITETNKHYKRYSLTENGISPRGIPGFGNGLISADSDEHDENGHITENLDLRVAMVRKRLKKLDVIFKDSIPPRLIGSSCYTTLLIGWGSTFHPIREALESLERSDVSLLHFTQVYPLHPETTAFLSRAKHRIVIEGNATAQFARLIKTETGYDADHKILKYNGLQFTVEEIIERLEKIMNGKA